MLESFKPNTRKSLNLKLSHLKRGEIGDACPEVIVLKVNTASRSVDHLLIPVKDAVESGRKP